MKHSHRILRWALAGAATAAAGTILIIASENGAGVGGVALACGALMIVGSFVADVFGLADDVEVDEVSKPRTTDPGLGRIHEQRAVICAECPQVYDRLTYVRCPSCTSSQVVEIATLSPIQQMRDEMRARWRATAVTRIESRQRLLKDIKRVGP